MLEKICTDLETSKKLKSLGISMKSDFYYRDGEELFCQSDLNIPEGVVLAYTLEQILEALPQLLFLGFNDYMPESEENAQLVIKLYDNILCEEYRPVELYYHYDGFGDYDDEYYKTTNDNINENLATTAARLLIKLKNK